MKYYLILMLLFSISCKDFTSKQEIRRNHVNGHFYLYTCIYKNGDDVVRYWADSIENISLELIKIRKIECDSTTEMFNNVK